MTQQARQDAFLGAADELSVLDGPTLTRLLHAVPDPEQAIRYLVDKQLIEGATAVKLTAAYRRVAAEIPQADARPANRVMPSPPAPPPRPGDETTRKQPERPPSRQRQPDTEEIDAFDAMIDDILND